jgi:hypothetical protein
VARQVGSIGQSVHDVTAYEVRCHRCKVSFPVGTRRCLHCGGRTGAPSMGEAASPRLLGPPGPFDPGAVDEEEMETRRGPLRVAMGVVWVLLALVLSFYRVCTG